MPKISKITGQVYFSQDAIVAHRQAIGSIQYFLNTSGDSASGADCGKGLEMDADIESLLRASTALINDLSALRRDACRVGVASGVSIRELARQMGISHSTVRFWLMAEEPGS